MLLWSAAGLAQENYTQDHLFGELKTMDSLIFEYAFKQCDTTALKPLVTEDLEFYHDQSGASYSREAFLGPLPGLCRMSYKPIRKLVKGSLQVFPLYDQGKLYGAIQTGEHEFYAKEGNLPVYLTSTAKFTHLWLLIEDKWKLKRVLSYDHKVPH